MASSAKYYSLTLLSLILLSSLYRPANARESRFFNKESAADVVPDSPQQEQQPDFFPQNEYGNRHAFADPYPSSASHEPQRLPRSHYPVSYVSETNDVYYRDRNYNYDPAGEDSEIGNNFGKAENNYNNGGGSFRQQGMSDTRYVEGGKYFYDLQSEEYSRNHPYNSGNSNRKDGESGYGFNGGGNSGGAYKRQFGLQDEADSDLP